MAAAEREAGTTEWEEMRAIFEHAEHAIAVYRFADGRVKTVCISDGLYAMMHTAEERDKEALIRRYDTDMYRNVVPEDAARIAAEAKRFATEGGRYDVVYREKVYQRNYYTLTHAVGYHHYLSDGSRIAVIVYTDIEDAERTGANSSTATPRCGGFFGRFETLTPASRSRNGSLAGRTPPSLPWWPPWTARETSRRAFAGTGRK